MSFWNDFKAFAVKGNVMDLAVGVIIGGAFGKIVTALVEDLIMPLVGMIGTGNNFTDKFFVLYLWHLLPESPGTCIGSVGLHISAFVFLWRQANRM